MVVCIAVLLAAASGLRFTRLGLDFVTGLPDGAAAKQAAEAASKGFAPGIIAPTQVVVRAAGIAGQTAALTSLERNIAAQPGVAGVAGPREQAAVPSVPFATSKDGNAARYLVVLNADPLGSAGIAVYDRLRSAMPAMLARAGLGGAQVQYSGDTALAQYAVGRTLGDLARVGVAVCLLDLLLLMVFLRTLFAPLYLVAASVLALAATLGLTTYVFQTVFGGEDIGYYVPFAASVLLISLGSDYNVFLVGRIWEERRRRPLRGAIETAVPRARRAISVAALALTLSFAMLAFVDLATFRQLAFLLAAGSSSTRSSCAPSSCRRSWRSSGAGRSLSRRRTRRPERTSHPGSRDRGAPGGVRTPRHGASTPEDSRRRETRARTRHARGARSEHAEETRQQAGPCGRRRDAEHRRAIGREGAADLEGDPRQRRRGVRRGRAGTPHRVRRAQAQLRKARRPLGAQEKKGASDPRSTQPTERAREGVGKTFGGIDYYGHIKKEFEQRARELGITGYSRMRKEELVEAIERKEKNEEARRRKAA